MVGVLRHYPVRPGDQPECVGQPGQVRQLGGPGVGGGHYVQRPHPLRGGGRGLSVHYFLGHFLLRFMTTMDCSEMIFASLDVQPSKYLLCAFDEILGFNEKCWKVFWLAIMQIVEKIPMKCFCWAHT